MKKIVIGIDQSYNDTSIAIGYDGQIINVISIKMQTYPNNTARRKAVAGKFTLVADKARKIANMRDSELCVIMERIRLRSQKFLSIDYIKTMGALNALIVDICVERDIPIYSVDTRAWKSAIIGSSKGAANPYGFDEKKWPTIVWCVKNGYKKQIIDYNVGRKKKAVIVKKGKKYTYNDNKADSIAICLYGFLPANKQLLQEEH